MATSVIQGEAVSVRPGLPSRLFALMPLWVLLIVSALSPITVQAIGTTPPAIYGAPWGLVVEAAAMLWMIVGLIAIWTSESRLVESLSLAVFTIPATVVVVLTPVVMLVLQDAG